MENKDYGAKIGFAGGILCTLVVVRSILEHKPGYLQETTPVCFMAGYLIIAGFISDSIARILIELKKLNERNARIDKQPEQK